VLADGTKLPSVTTLLKFSNKFDNSSLNAWKKRVGKEEAAKVSNQAKRRGSAIHNLAEKYLNNEEAYAKGAMPFNLAAFRKLQKVLDENVICVYGIEFPLFSKKYKTAGRADLVAFWGKEPHGEISIVDFKTSKRPKKEEDIQNYFVQAATYAALFEELCKCPISQIVVIVLVDHEEPQVFVRETSNYHHLVEKIFLQ
jgi:hypothetical protein